MSTPQPTGNALLEAALAQARLGFRIYHARPGTKRPQWTGYKERATTDEATLTAWWTRYPHANPMALIPPGVAIVDVDPRHGGHDGLRTLEMQHSALPGTWTVETRHGGTHRYYLLPDNAQLAQSTHLAAGVEVLGPQCPLTIPGFVHDDGHVNRWEEFCNPATMHCTPIPLWLLDLTGPRTAPKPTRSRPTTVQTPPPTTAEPATPLSQGSGKTAAHSAGGGTEVLAPCAVPPEKLTGRAVADLLREHAPLCIGYLAGLLDRPAPQLGESFLAWFRAEGKPSAAFLRPTATHPHVLYFDHGDRNEADQPRKGQTLPSVYYRVINGAWPGTLKPATYLAWSVRLLLDSGVLQVPDGHFPPLPGDAPPEAAQAYRGFQTLWRVHALLPAEHDDQPYSESFCAAWIHVSARTAHRALMWLLSRGYLLVHRCKERLYYFLKGTKRLIARLGAGRIATNQQDAVVLNTAAQTAVQSEPVVPRRPGQRDATDQPQVCPACDKDGFAPVGEGCEWCVLLLPLQARLEAKKRLYGSPPVVELPRVRGGAAERA